MIVTIQTPAAAKNRGGSADHLGGVMSAAGNQSAFKRSAAPKMPASNRKRRRFRNRNASMPFAPRTKYKNTAARMFQSGMGGMFSGPVFTPRKRAAKANVELKAIKRKNAPNTMQMIRTEERKRS